MSNSKNASGAAGVRRWGVCLAVSSAFLGIAGLSAEPAKAALPVATLAAGSPAQAGFGTIKGRLVWGGADVPQPKVLQEVGKATKDPEVCAKDKAILSRELVVDPKTKGIQHGFAYLVKPSGANPEAVAGLVKKAAKVVDRPEELRVHPVQHGGPPGPGPRVQVERPGQPQRPLPRPSPTPR